jgi:hypothetical protein
VAARTNRGASVRPGCDRCRKVDNAYQFQTD